MAHTPPPGYPVTRAPVNRINIHERHVGTLESTFATDSGHRERQATTKQMEEKEATLVNHLDLATSSLIHAREMADAVMRTINNVSEGLYANFSHDQHLPLYAAAQYELMGPILTTARQSSAAATTALNEVHSILQTAIANHRHTQDAIVWDTNRLRRGSVDDVGGDMTRECTHVTYEECRCIDGQLGGHVREGNVYLIEGGGFGRV